MESSQSLIKVSFLTAPHCQFRGVGQGMKQTYMYRWYPLFHAEWDRYNLRNHNLGKAQGFK